MLTTRHRNGIPRRLLNSWLRYAESPPLYLCAYVPMLIRAIPPSGSRTIMNSLGRGDLRRLPRRRCWRRAPARVSAATVRRERSASTVCRSWGRWRARRCRRSPRRRGFGHGWCAVCPSSLVLEIRKKLKKNLAYLALLNLHPHIYDPRSSMYAFAPLHILFVPRILLITVIWCI